MSATQGAKDRANKSSSNEDPFISPQVASKCEGVFKVFRRVVKVRSRSLSLYGLRSLRNSNLTERGLGSVSVRNGEDFAQPAKCVVFGLRENS